MPLPVRVSRGGVEIFMIVAGAGAAYDATTLLFTVAIVAADVDGTSGVTVADGANTADSDGTELTACVTAADRGRDSRKSSTTPNSSFNPSKYG